MALPTSSDLVKLDYDNWGQPIVVMPLKTSVSPTALDVDVFGQPLGFNSAVPPDIIFSPTACVITITAPAIGIDIGVKRTFPLPRAESPRESQIKHVFPSIEYQDPAFIP